MAEWNPKANELFLQAAEFAKTAERSRFLEERCAGDDALRAQVEALLATSAKIGSFLNRPAVVPAITLAPQTPPSAAEAPGSRIGLYKLLQQIGEGGMGTVWMAEQFEPVRRTVAFKIVKAGLDSAQVVARFEAERQALALMDHPNIARVLDAGSTESGRPYFVMELVKGVPITRYCDTQRLTLRQRLELFIPVCQAIQHAHQKGIIHRDIKPSNVLIAPYDGKPVVKVIDFGIAKAMGQRLTEKTLFTEFGAVIGTLEYMSPEQAELNNQDVDTRSDVYSLGVLLYELLTGTTPLDMQRLRGAAFAALLMQIVEEEPPRPSTRISTSGPALATISQQRNTEPARLARLVRGELDWIVMKSLEKDRMRRYETATSLARDLERYLLDEPVEACPPSVSYRAIKLWRRNRGPVFAAGLVLLALVGGIIGTTWGLLRAEQARDAEAEQRLIAQVNEKDAQEEKSKAIEAALEEQRAKEEAINAKKAEASERQKAESERDAKAKALVRADGLRLTAQSSAELHTDPSLGLLLAIEAANVSPSKETNEALVAALDACYEERTLLGHQGVVLSARFTPDGKRILSCAKDGTVCCWDAQTGKQLWTTPDFGPLGGQFMSSVILSPDGRYFAALYEGAAHAYLRNNQQVRYTDRVVRLWDAATGKQVCVLRGHKARVVAATFSADGKRLVTASLDKTARIWEVPSGKERTMLKGHASGLFSARFSLDGRQVLTISSSAWTSGSAPNEGQYSGPGAIDPEDIRMPAPGESLGGGWSGGSSGSNIHNLDEKILARVWDAETGAVQAEILKPTGFLRKSDEVPSFGHFSPDGKRVVLGFMDDAQVWEVAAGKMLFKLKHGGMSGEDHAAWSPNGKRIATIRGSYVSIWDAADGKELTTLRGHEGTLRTQSFSADGKLVLTTSWDRTARVWNTETGEPVAVFRGHKDRVNTASLSPDGQRVVTASADATVRLWWLSPPKGQAQPLAEPIVNFNVMSLSSDGRFLATGASYQFQNPGPRLWDAQTGKLLHRLKTHREGIFAKLPDRSGYANVTGVVFSPDGRRLLSIADEELIKIRKGVPEPMFTIPFLSKPKPPANQDTGSDKDEPLPFTPARVWDVETGKQLLALQAGEASLSCACFSRDGRKILTADSDKKRYAVYTDSGRPMTSGSSSGGNLQTFVRIHDATTGKELLKLPYQGEILRAEFSADGRRVLTSGKSGTWPNKDIKMWDAENGTLLFALEKSASERVACMDPQGKRLVFFDNPIRIHDAENGKELIRFDGFDVWGENYNGRQLGLSPFSPDGKKLLVINGAGLGLVDVETGKQHVTFRGHSGALKSALWSPDGRFVVTASDDMTARVWDAATGKEVHLLRHKASVAFATMTADGRFVVTASDTVRIWNLEPLPIAIQRKPRELSPYEKDRFGIK